MIKEIALAEVRIDGGTQQRDIDDSVVLRYRALMEDGVEFPAVNIIFDGKSYWLYEGFHRYHANRKLDRKYIEADISEGTRRDAIAFSFKANHDSGFPRQPGVIKAMLIGKIFPDEEWGAMTDEALAAWIGGVTRRHVTKCRNEYEKAQNKGGSGHKNTHMGTGSLLGQVKSSKGSEPENEDLVDDVPDEVLDSLGNAVPDHMNEVFRRVGEIKELIGTINQVFKTCRDSQAKNDPLYVYCKVDSLKADISNARRNLRFTIPFAVCPYCGGDVNNADCRACGGKGYINESMYQAVPQDMK